MCKVFWLKYCFTIGTMIKESFVSRIVICNRVYLISVVSHTDGWIWGRNTPKNTTIYHKGNHDLNCQSFLIFSGAGIVEAGRVPQVGKGRREAMKLSPWFCPLHKCTDCWFNVQQLGIAVSIKTIYIAAVDTPCVKPQENTVVYVKDYFFQLLPTTGPFCNLMFRECIASLPSRNVSPCRGRQCKL